MKKLSKEKLITLLIILGVLLIAAVILKLNTPKTDEQISKCIGRNSVLYTRLGCHYCEAQEEIFGDNYEYLDVIDCFFEGKKCADITSTPTWIIDGKEYVGVQSFEELKELTGC